MRLGKYQLLRKLATGGMAEVFLAKTDGPMGFEKLLVIKRILPHLAEDPQFVEMFLAEAKLAAQLNHPNLVTLFDFGEAEGSYFIAMEYIDGPTLRLLLARARDLRSPISLALAARIVSSAAEGLAYAHDFRDHATGEPLHLVHRDVSPDNILVARSGAVKLVDFGIAKARGQSHHTQVGTVKGKVAYMAPEQLRGEPLDRRVDLYALGVVLYELCTGRMPFEAGSDASMVRTVLYDLAIPAVQRVPTLPRAIQSILDRLLAKDRNARYPDCRALHAELEAFIQSTGEPTNGFALSRLIAQLALPEPAAPPLPPTTLRGSEMAPGVTASAFAPTSPILLSEPVAEASAAPAPPPLEILDLDRTVRSDPRRMPPPPVAGFEVRPGASAGPAAPVAGFDVRPGASAGPAALDGRRPAAAPGASSSAFVFPTALEKERGSVAPVRLGLDRSDRRRTTGSVRRARGGGGVRTVGVVLLFAGLAALGAYLGLAAAHRTDLLARMGLPVPGPEAPAGSGSAPATSAQARTPGVPVQTQERPAAPAAPAPGTPNGPPSTPPTSARTAPGPSASSTAGPQLARAPGSAPGDPAAPATSSSPSIPSAPAQTPSAPETGTSAGPAAAAGVAVRDAPAASDSPATPAGTAEARTAEPAGPSPTTTDAPGSASRTAKSPGPSPAATADSTASATAARTAPKPASPDAARKATGESDKDKLLGAFAQLEVAKESTVRLESTPRLRVRMGGKVLGLTPVTLTIPAQEAPVDLEFFDPALGVSTSEQLALKPGDNGTHKVEIPKGKLVLKVEDGVTVTVDGKPAGTTPIVPLSLYEGKHTVQLTRGDQRERRTLEIRGDEDTDLEFTFPEAE